MAIGKYKPDGNIYSVPEVKEFLDGGGDDISELERKVNKNTDDISTLNVRLDSVENDVSYFKTVIPTNATPENELVTHNEIEVIDERLYNMDIEIDDIQNVIPSEASTQNKLVSHNELIYQSELLYGGNKIIMNDWIMYIEPHLLSEENESTIEAMFKDSIQVACTETSGNFYRSEIMEIPLPVYSSGPNDYYFTDINNIDNIQLTGGHSSYPCFPVLESIDITNQKIKYYWLSGNTRNLTGNYKIYCRMSGVINSPQ